MAEVITRLKLESGEYDAKIARAVQGLKGMEAECRNVNGTLAVLEKDQKEYVQSLGQMQTVSNTVRGKIGELSSAYTELAVQYRHLTDEEKKGDFGQALSQSLDQLKVRLQDTKQELAEVSKELDNTGKNSGGGIFSGLGGKMSGALQVFAGNMMTKAVGAIAGLGEQMADVVQEGVRLAQQGEGIRIAFERLGRGDILDGLRQATHGTVTDIELMKAAVKFNDFKLPLDELGTMLAFAQQKAKDTGQSVDYMVDSIVTGLGRKSLMILDNLGLSASEVKGKMAETGDMTKAVGAIIREQMSKAGEYVETAADRATKADVDLKNAMEDLGRTLSPLQEAGVSVFKAWEISALNFIKNALEPLIARFTEAGRLQASYERQGGGAKVDRMTDILKNTDEGKRQGLYNTQVNSFNRFIKERQEYINLLDSYRAGSRGEGNGYTAENKARIDQLYKRFGTDDTSRLQSQIDGALKQLKEYQDRAKDILNPSTSTQPVLPEPKAGNLQPRVTTRNTELPEVTSQKITVTIDDAEAIKRLQAIQGITIDPKTLDLVATDNATSAIDKVEGVEFTPKTIEIEVDSDEAMKELNKIEGISITIPFKIESSGTESMAELIKQMSTYKDMLNNAKTTEEYNTAIEGINRTKRQQEVQTTALQLGRSTNDVIKFEDSVSEQLNKQLNETFANMDPVLVPIVPNSEDFVKEGNQAAKSWAAASTAVSGIGNALKQIEDPAAKIFGIIAQAVANVAAGFAGALARPESQTGGVWGWIAAAAAGTATMISTIAAIKSATDAGAYAEGGIIPGNNYNDGLVAHVSSGELILNRAQQDSIANQLTTSDMSMENPVSSQPYVSGEKIFLGLNNYLRASGRGELITSRR